MWNFRETFANSMYIYYVMHAVFWIHISTTEIASPERRTHPLALGSLGSQILRTLRIKPELPQSLAVCLGSGLGMMYTSGSKTIQCLPQTSSICVELTRWAVRTIWCWHGSMASAYWWICFYGISIGFLWDFHGISMIFLGKLDPPALWDENKMKPTNPNAHTYVNGTDVKTHGFAVTHDTCLQ